jgi:hypothetical protein
MHLVWSKNCFLLHEEVMELTWNCKNVSFVEKMCIFRWFSFRKTYSPCVEQVNFQVYFPSFINTRYISISFCLTDGHTFSGAIICVKFNGFQAFLRKWRENVLFMMSQCSQIKNNLWFVLQFWYTWQIFCFPITKIKLLSRHILDPRKFLGLFMYTTVPCSL